MKFSMNGALTIGTFDGANIEIREAVDPDNFFLFGLKADEVTSLRMRGYKPWDFYSANAELREVLERIGGGHFSPGEPDLFRPLVDELLSQDRYFLLADYQSYVDCQKQVAQAYQDSDRWWRMSILNTARIGRFSSDRTVAEYSRWIWGIEPVKVRV
jgi:starch phosphorylase